MKIKRHQPKKPLPSAAPSWILFWEDFDKYWSLHPNVRKTTKELQIRPHMSIENDEITSLEIDLVA